MTSSSESEDLPNLENENPTLLQCPSKISMTETDIYSKHRERVSTPLLLCMKHAHKKFERMHNKGTFTFEDMLSHL